jgi:hypothetical protein
MIGDLFGGSRLQIFVQPPGRNITTNIPGFGISEIPGDPNWPVFFSLSPDGPIYLISDVPGFDASGDGLADTFPVNSPPSDLNPVVNEPGTLTYVGGNIIYTAGTGAAVNGEPFAGRNDDSGGDDTSGGDPPPYTGPLSDAGGPVAIDSPNYQPQNMDQTQSVEEPSSQQQPTSQAVPTAVPADPQALPPDSQFTAVHRFAPQRLLLDVPSPGAGGGVGRVKIAENTSPLPRDRIFHNFSYFDNVPLAAGGVNVSRFTPGFEKTLFDGVMSVEMRFPMAVTLDNTIVVDGVTNTDEVEFGNLSVPLKVLLYADPTFACSLGLQVTLPTADDTRVFLQNGTELVHIENEAVHLMPFLGALYTPNDRFFAQGFLQFDVDSGGNGVSALGVTPVLDQATNLTLLQTNSSLTYVGNLRDATLMYIDVGLGYWLFRNSAARGLTGLAPIFEVHVNQSIEKAEVLSTNVLRIGSVSDNVSTTNAVIGANLQFGQNTGLTIAYATPLSDSPYDFDGEVRVLFNHIFGAPRNRSRAPF